MTLDRARTEIMRLQYYVDLIEMFEPINIEQEIVKEYAITNSIPKVCEKLNVSHENVVDVLTSRGKDELHKMVRSGYMKKTNHIRSYSY